MARCHPLGIGCRLSSEVHRRRHEHAHVVIEQRARRPRRTRSRPPPPVGRKRRVQILNARRRVTREQGRSPILLTERKDHLEYFVDHLRRLTRHLVVLQGGMGERERRAAKERLAAIPDGEEHLVLATSRYIGEGFDNARLDTLFLALPVSWKGTLIQYTGRLHRIHPAKNEVRVFDYVDREVPMLLRMFEKRLRGYRAIGYARGEAPLGYGEPVHEVVLECDEETLQSLESDEFA